MTQILNLPLVEVGIDTGTNEDWRDSIGFTAANGSALDISGIAFRMMLREKAEDAQAWLDVSTASAVADGQLVNGGATGVLGIAVPLAKMKRIHPGDYVMDIVATGDGISRVAARGNVSVVLGVTR